MANGREFPDSGYWKKRAEESRARASEMPDPEARAEMLDIARMYDLLTKQAAEREAASRGSANDPY